MNISCTALLSKIIVDIKRNNTNIFIWSQLFQIICSPLKQLISKEFHMKDKSMRRRRNGSFWEKQIETIFLIAHQARLPLMLKVVFCLKCLISTNGSRSSEKPLGFADISEKLQSAIKTWTLEVNSHKLAEFEDQERPIYEWISTLFIFPNENKIFALVIYEKL